MAPPQAHHWHAQARQRWPRVTWPLERFVRHVGDTTPTHPLDLYLGGAAGWRLDPAWIELNSSYGPKARSVFRRLPTADLDPDELWSEVVAKLIEDQPAHEPDGDSGVRPCRLVAYRGDAALVNFLILVGRRIAISRARSPRHETARLGDTDVEATPNGRAYAASPTEETERFRAAAAALGKAIDALPGESRAVLLLAKGFGIKQSTLAERLGWSEAKVSRRLSTAIAALGESVRDDPRLEGVDLSEEAWGRIWRLCVERMKSLEGPSVLDDGKPPTES